MPGSTLKQQEYLFDLADQHPVDFKKHVGNYNHAAKRKAAIKNLTARKAREGITGIKDDVKTRTGRNAGSQLGILSDRLLAHEKLVTSTGIAVKDVTKELLPNVGVWKGLTWSTNTGHGGRKPLPIDKQKELFKNKVNTLAKELATQHKKGKDKGGEKKKQQFGSIYQQWKAFVREARKYAESRNADRDAMDQVGLRPMEHGCSMLEANIPIDALKDAMTMHWPLQARKDLGVKEFDFQSYRKSDREPDKHACFPYIMALHEAGVPIFLTGPKGTGKTTMAYQLTETVFGKGTDRFGVVSMTSGTSPSAFNGRPRIAGKDTTATILAMLAAGNPAEEVLEFAMREHQESDVVQSQWERVYSGGGGFLFDELDAADENLLLLVNTALSNGYFSNTASGEIVYQHEDFTPIAAGNTIGVGAQRGYTGRNRLDDATLDRWNMGRVRVTLDPRIEDMICRGYDVKIGA